jgi:ketosteroid isomerase-like protein
MSQENVEVVRRIARAFNERDVDALVAELDPGVEWEEQPIPGVDPVYRGHEGVRRWAQTLLGPELRSLQVRVEELSEAGDAVIASGRARAEGRSSGVEIGMPLHIVFTFRGGQVVRRQVFQRRAAALEAVGLRE